MKNNEESVIKDLAFAVVFTLLAAIPLLTAFVCHANGVDISDYEYFFAIISALWIFGCCGTIAEFLTKF